MKKKNYSKFVDFTRGSELWTHQFRMFITGISNVLILCLFITVFVMGLFLYLKVDNTQFYAIKTELEIAYKSTLNVPNKEIELYINGVPEKVSIKEAEQIIEPYLSSFWWAVERALLIGLILSISIVGGLIWYWYNYGRDVMEDEQLRGAKLVEKEKLIELLNQRDEASHYTIAGVPIRKGTEGNNICCVGAPQSGKSQAIRALLAQIRARGKKAVVYDPSGEFTQEFFREGKDIILNPFDERCPQWSVWNEVEEDHHIDSIGDGLIPITPTGDQFFPPAARRLISDVIRVLGQNEATKTNKRLFESISLSTLQELHEMLAGTSGATYVDPKTEKTGINIKMQILNYLTPFRFLKDEGEKFSIREWVREEDDSWVFITTKEEQKEAIKPIISLWISTVIKATMSLPAIHKERMWLCIDEMPTLQKMDDLVLSLTNTRKYGLCHLIGLQDFSQSVHTYGKDVSSTIISTLQTKLILRVTDSDSAEKLSKIIGQMEVDEKNMSRSMGVTDGRDGDSFYGQRKERNVVMAAEIMNLPNLVGYLKIVGDYPVTKVITEYVPHTKNSEPFIARKKAYNEEVVSELTNVNLAQEEADRKQKESAIVQNTEEKLVDENLTIDSPVIQNISDESAVVDSDSESKTETLVLDQKTGDGEDSEQLLCDEKLAKDQNLSNDIVVNKDDKSKVVNAYQTNFFDSMDDIVGDTKK